jgi:hypothetical protein
MGRLLASGSLLNHWKYPEDSDIYIGIIYIYIYIYIYYC